MVFDYQSNCFDVILFYTALINMVGRVGVEPTTLIRRTDLQSAAFADSLPAHIYLMVGITGLEPAASRSQTACSTKLS